MKFAKTCDPGTNKSVNDKTTVPDNAHFTIRDITDRLETMKIVEGVPKLDI